MAQIMCYALSFLRFVGEVFISISSFACKLYTP